VGPAGSDTFTGVSGSTYVDPGTWTTPLDAIRARAGSSVKVTHAQGTEGDPPLTTSTSTVLRPPAGAAGLTASYYTSADGTGTPVTTRTDTTVDFTAAPVEGLPQVWSAKWTGTRTPTSTGLHRFSLLPSGTTTLTIDGPTVVPGTRPTARLFLRPPDYPLPGPPDPPAGRALTAGTTHHPPT